MQNIDPPAEQNHRICIITPDKNAYSETFIRAHIERLPGAVHCLYGNDVLYKENGQPLVPPANILQRGLRLILRKIFKTPVSEETLRHKALKNFLRGNKIEAILAEYGPTGYAVRKVCQDTKVPLIVHFHGYDAYEDKTLIKFNRYKDLFTAAKAIIVVSKHMRKQLLELGAPIDKVKYIPYGVDVVQFKGAMPQHAMPAFIAVGRFVDKKAPHMTLLAFKKVLEQVPDARLMMFGAGPLLEACQQLSSALKMNGAVSFKGIRSSDEIALGMRKARAFIQHSLQTTCGDSEGTPVAVLEASASGLPVVATRHAGIPDVVLDGQTGLLCDEGDIEGMAQAMLRLAHDPFLAGEMGRKARERVREHFTMDRSIRNLYDVIRSIINHTKRPFTGKPVFNSIEEYFLLAEPISH